MDQRHRAEEHLRVIRTLMERATIYRAISAPTALVGGCIALALATGIFVREGWWLPEASEIVPQISARTFASLWLGALVAVIVVNTLFVWREASRARRRLISPAMKLALSAILPCLVLPAAVTTSFFLEGHAVDNEFALVRAWIGFYGLALIATQHFAPRSLVVLGWAFLITAAITTIGFRQFGDYTAPFISNIAMGVTFGLFHLVYAACVWRSPVSAQSTSE